MRTKTILTAARFAKENEAYTAVTLPHTWNAFDGQDGGNDYWRGIGTYLIDLPDPTPGMEQYIEFQGANHVATVWCNGRELGTHKGGFSTFRYELTPAMKKADNILTVAVSNAVSNIYPQVADFTFFGGLYRDVSFIEVEPAHFDLLKDGTQAVFVTPHVSGYTRVDLFPINAESCDITVELKDAEGNVAGTACVEASEHAHVLIDVTNPHLWQGMDDPYCYTATAAIVKDGKTLDTVVVTYGYRSFHVDADTGFYLNGKNTPLRGVSRHQDRQDKGWAVSRADHEEDIALIKEIGANTIRLAHYQHDQYFYDLCDHTGFALWAEIPFISKFIHGPEAYENTISQMTELVAQNYNHPSIFFWGIANEILVGVDTEPLRQNLRDLHKLAKSMDPSRLTTIAEVSTTPVNSEHIYITDLVSYNHYFGWYDGTVEDNGPWLDSFRKLNPDVPLGLSEYGVENVVKWHSATPMNHDYTEEYADYYHHGMLKTIASRPYLWSTHVWNMFDFAADARNEGGVQGRNNKGLVTYDRKTKKDAFFLYKAYWSKSPFIHIAGRRFADRAPDERNITVYTNCERVALVVNGVEVATQDAVDHVVVFKTVDLKDGENIVTALFEKHDQVVRDSITLNGVAQHNDDYTLPDIAAAMAVGNWFDEVADNNDSESIVAVEGHYSVYDTCKEVLAQDECTKIVKGWLVSAGQMGFASMLTFISDLMEGYTIKDLGEEAHMNQKQMAQLNRMLSRVKKS